MRLNYEKRDLLYSLQALLQDCTSAGLFDVLAADVDPKIINEFCDSIKNLTDNSDKQIVN